MRKTREMTVAEIACMLEHGNHEWDLYETRFDYVYNRAHHWWLTVLDWAGGLFRQRDFVSRFWIQWRLHERCAHCGKTRRAS